MKAELTDVACSVEGKNHELIDGVCVHCAAKLQICYYCTTGYFIDTNNDHSPYCCAECGINAQGDR